MILSPVSKTTPLAAPGPVPSPKRNVVPTPSLHTSLVRDAAKAYGDPTSSSAASKKLPHAPKLPFNVFRSKKQPAKTTVEEQGIFFKIYCDDRGKLYKAWIELNKKMKQNIGDRTISDAIIKKFADGDVDKVRKLERDFDIEIKVDQVRGEVRFKGHLYDIPSVHEKIIEILKDIKDNESKGNLHCMIITNYYQMNKFSFRFSGYRRTRQRGGRQFWQK